MTKYVCRGLVGLYVNFHNNRTMWSPNLHVKNCRWGGVEEKEPNRFLACKNGSLQFPSPLENLQIETVEKLLTGILYVRNVVQICSFTCSR